MVGWGWCMMWFLDALISASNEPLHCLLELRLHVYACRLAFFLLLMDQLGESVHVPQHITVHTGIEGPYRHNVYIYVYVQFRVGREMELIYMTVYAKIKVSMDQAVHLLLSWGETIMHYPTMSSCAHIHTFP